MRVAKASPPGSIVSTVGERKVQSYSAVVVRVSASSAEIAGGSAVTRKKTILGNYDEPRSPLNRPTRDSHPGVVVFMGWFFLIGLPPLVYWIGTR